MSSPCLLCKHCNIRAIFLHNRSIFMWYTYFTVCVCQCELNQLSEHIHTLLICTSNFNDERVGMGPASRLTPQWRLAEKHTGHNPGESGAWVQFSHTFYIRSRTRVVRRALGSHQTGYTVNHLSSNRHQSGFCLKCTKVLKHLLARSTLETRSPEPWSVP